MLLIYPAQDAPISGQAVINGSLTADFALEAGYAPGQAVVLAFDPIDISSLVVSFSNEALVGEIMLLGSAK